MSPTLPLKQLPNRTRRPTKHSEQSQALLASERKKTAKINARRDLKSRRTQQQVEWETQAPAAFNSPSSARVSQLPATGSYKGKQRDHGSQPSTHHSSNSHVIPTSAPSTTHATVNASIGAGLQGPTDDILQGVLEEEREWKEEIAWFAKHYPTRNVATLDLEELVQLRRELGPGPTLPQNHNPYPNVRVESQPRPPQPLSNRLSQANGQTRGGWHDINIEEELGVNSSFSQRPAHTKASSMVAQPLLEKSGVRPPPQSQPAPQSRPYNSNAEDLRRRLSHPTHTTASFHAPAPVNQRVPISSPNFGLNSTAGRRPSSIRPQPAPRSTSSLPALSLARSRLVHADATQPRMRSPPPRPVPNTREPPTAAALRLNIDPADLERIVQVIDDTLQGRNQGDDKPKCSEWTGLTLQLVDRAADDSKASLIAAGYMKVAEDRELIILQAWDRACEWYHVRRQFPKITQRQIRYIQNLFPSCRKLMKTRLAALAVADYHLRDGTVDQIRAHVAELLLHEFHSLPSDEVHGTLHFEHKFIRVAISAMIFQGPRDLGIKFNALFNPIPPRVVALACAMVADVISEYSLGEHNGKSTYIETLRPLYNTYIASLKNLRRAHLDRYRNLLVRLHDDCIAKSGAMREAENEEPDDIIPIEAFDVNPVERYEPRYAAEHVLAMLTKDHIVDNGNSQLDHEEELEPRDSDIEELEPEGLDVGMNEGDYGVPGPGPSTLFNRKVARASDGKDYGWDGPGDGSGGGTRGWDDVGDGMGGEDYDEEWE